MTDQEKISAIIKSMTLRQKAELLIGTDMHMDLPDSVQNMFQKPKDKNLLTPEYKTMVDHIRSFLPGAAGFSAEFPELGISSQVLADGPAGLRISPTRKNDEQTYYCTAFPIATALASSWDTTLVDRVGTAMGSEVLEYGADVLLAPGMNLQRDVLCGRNFEYYSEDPLVTGKMAAHMVKGIQSNGVGTSIKHFAVNNQETNRLSVNTIVSERALRELYLRGFEIAVKEAKPWTVMSAYNKVNGVYASENHDLLTKVLRDDWGFEGYVMTDWGAGSDVVAQMKAGNDLIMPGQPEQINELEEAVKAGKIEESVLDTNLMRILSVMLKSPKYKGYKNSNKPDLAANAKLTRQAATEGMVLLENKAEALPLPASVKQVALFGTTSYEFISGGTGSGDVNEAYTVSLLNGLENAQLSVDNTLATTYQAYIKETRASMPPPKNWLAALLGGKDPVPEMSINNKLVGAAASSADIALVTFGRNSGEAGDRKAEKGDFYLSDTERNVLEQVSKQFHAQGKKVIVVLNVGGAIETQSWKDLADAVLCAWQPGQEAGNSVADVLTGKTNPSGKLAVTFPVNYENSPSAKSFPGHEVKSEVVDDSPDLSGFGFMQRVPWEVIYDEDIYVGYRYYNTFDVPVAYEFGYGKSYTTFEYSGFTISSKSFSDKLTLSVKVKNTGKIAGKEIAQLYLSKAAGKLEKPKAELVAFAKTKLLQPGEEQSLEFSVSSRDLCSFDETRHAWVAEAGTYTVAVGASSRTIYDNKTFDLPQELVVQTVSAALLPQVVIEKTVKQ